MLDSVTDLRSLLKDPSLLATKAYVAGEWIDADDGTSFEVTNPARGDVIARVPNLAIVAATSSRSQSVRPRMAAMCRRPWASSISANAASGAS